MYTDRDFGFTEEQMLLRDSVRDFVRNEVPEDYVRHCDQNKIPPLDTYDKMADLGWLGVAIPEEYGGSGLGFVELGIIQEELSYGFLELAVLFYRATVHGAHSLLTYGSEEQRRKYLPLIVEGKFKSSMSLTEPNAGSDASAVQTRAVADGDHFIINGAKVFNSQIDLADRTVLVTRTDTEVPNHKGISLFFVDPKTPGVTIERLETLCFRSVGTNRVTYEDVRVHRDDLLGDLNGGWKHLMTNLNKERFSLAAQVTGASQAALDCALNYAKERVQFGQPIGKFQAIQHKLADMQVAVHTSRLLTYDLARRLDAGLACRKEASIAKVYTTEAYSRVADEGMQILGGYSLTPDFPMERHFRDARLMRIGGGSNEVMRNSIAKDLGL
ncbi:MAG: butyryl-CoA dehydrogenase [Pseudooceanicola sp.]|nr:butyryl-CoA dehydrogenase [Pseudooceanicola sp.]|tara:strand:- start:8839 stop:9993 length:1155 start_codon:yes stop_codon:yes gene_type:complete